MPTPVGPRGEGGEVECIHCTSKSHKSEICDFLKDFIYYKGYYHPKYTANSDQCSLSTDIEQLDVKLNEATNFCLSTKIEQLNFELDVDLKANINEIKHPTVVNVVHVPESKTSDSDSSESSSGGNFDLVKYVNNDSSKVIENRVKLKAKRNLKVGQSKVVKVPDVNVSVEELTDQLELLEAISQVDSDAMIYCNCGYTASKRNYWYQHHVNSTYCKPRFTKKVT